VAVPLAALYAGAINFPQATVMVIGMDMGSTMTAALATTGSTVGYLEQAHRMLYIIFLPAWVHYF